MYDVRKWCYEFATNTARYIAKYFGDQPFEYLIVTRLEVWFNRSQQVDIWSTTLLYMKDSNFLSALLKDTRYSTLTSMHPIQGVLAFASQNQV